MQDSKAVLEQLIDGLEPIFSCDCVVDEVTDTMVYAWMGQGDDREYRGFSIERVDQIESAYPGGQFRYEQYAISEFIVTKLVRTGQTLKEAANTPLTMHGLDDPEESRQ